MLFVGREETGFAGRQGHRLDAGRGRNLPCLCARRPLHQPAQGAADQQLHLRLSLLHQPQVLQRAARPVHGAGGGGPDAGLLPPQLHRRAVSLLRHHSQPRLYDGADRRSGALPARGSRFSRLYPPQDHSRCRSRAHRGGGPPCRPRVDQCRIADRQRPPAPGARKVAGAVQRPSRTAPMPASASAPPLPLPRRASRPR